MAAGILMCYVAMIGVYYGNAWGGRALPFMSTRLLHQDGSVYDTGSVFDEGVLNRAKLQDFGLPWLTSTYTWASVVGNMAVGSAPRHDSAKRTDWTDRCSCWPLCLLLGWPDVANSQRASTGRISRSSSPCHETLQGHPVVVVRDDHGDFVYLWACRCPQIECRSRCRRIRLGFGDWRIYCPFRACYSTKGLFSTDINAERHPVLPLREWYRHKSALQDARRCHHSRSPAGQPILHSVVTQCHLAELEPCGRPQAWIVS